MKLRTLHIASGLLVAVLSSSLLAHSASAALVTVLNPSFEDDVLADGDFTPGSFTDWNVSNNSGGVFNPTTTSFPSGVPDGENVAYSNTATISQTLSATLAANTQYRLRVDVGNRDDLNFNGYTVGLYANNVLLAEDNNTLSPADGTFDLSTVFLSIGAVHAQLGQALEIRLTSNGVQTNFDNVRLATVPEPASLLFGAVALGTFGVARRRRRTSPVAC